MSGLEVPGRTVSSLDRITSQSEQISLEWQRNQSFGRRSELVHHLVRFSFIHGATPKPGAFAGKPQGCQAAIGGETVESGLHGSGEWQWHPSLSTSKRLEVFHGSISKCISGPYNRRLEDSSSQWRRDHSVKLIWERFWKMKGKTDTFVVVHLWAELLGGIY